MSSPLRRQGSTSSTYTEFEDLDLIRECQSFSGLLVDQPEEPDSRSGSGRAAYPTPSTTASGSGPSQAAVAPSHGIKRKLSDGSCGSPSKIGRQHLDPASGSGKRGDSDSEPYEFNIGARLDDRTISAVRKLGVGVRFELARLISTGTALEQHISKIVSKLRGSHVEIGPRVLDLVTGTSRNEGTDTGIASGRAKELLAKAPWKELDREAAALAESPVGCMGTPTTTGKLAVSLPQGWYGGQVLFSAKLLWGLSGLRLELIEPEIGASTRLTRRFGSHFILRVRISKDVFTRPANMDVAIKFLYRPLVIFGRVYRLFYANKEHVAFYMATNEGMNADDLDHICLPSYLEFVNLFNPMQANSRQTMAKYLARFALGLSNSIPGLELEDHQIINISEIISSAYNGQGKVPTEMEMTDGCGFINLYALQRLYEKKFWERVPIAIQCRILGGKGILILNPSSKATDHPLVHLRPSQVKIKYPAGHPLQDPIFHTIDVLRVAHLKSSIQLGREMIINLEHNGVCASVFQDLMHKQQEELVGDVLAWEKASDDQIPDAMVRLWLAVEKIGHVLSARAARENPGTARIRGLRSYDKDDVEDEGDDDEDLEEDARNSRSIAWFPDEISGCPSSLEETVMTFIEGGFTPRSNDVMADKLWVVAKNAVKNLNRRYRLMVPMSCTAFCVPDPLGVLEEGEVHIKCSMPSLLLPDGRKVDRVSGDVLVSRNPCKLPTDIRKVKAVCRAELDEYNDVIIFSIKGNRSLASMLGGGDYDGDKVEVIWQPEIVESFHNAPAHFADIPANFADNFKTENETVEEFLHSVPSSLPTSERICRLQERIVRPLRDLPVGIYANAHINSVYLYGYDNTETVRLGRMFCTILDGAKTGITVQPDVQKDDVQKFRAMQRPYWMERVKPTRDLTQKSKLVYLPRDISRLGKFVLDTLDDDIQQEQDRQLKRIEKCLKECMKHFKPDPDLLAPTEEADRRATELDKWLKAGAGASTKFGGPRPKTMREEFTAIDDHVLEVYKEHKERVGGRGSSRGGKGKGKAHGFTELPIEARQDILRAISRKFDSYPPREADGFDLKWFSYREAVRIRASLAYHHAVKERGSPSRFPWDVAMRELCDIKAKARDGWRTVYGELHDAMRVRKM